MTTYEWKCRECFLLFTKDFPMGKAPTRRRCPKCSVLCERNFQVTPVHFKGSGWTQTTGYNKAGGSDEINLKLQDGCKERIATGWQQYARYEPSEGYIKAKKGRKLSSNEVKDKLEHSRKVTATTYEKAGMDPTKKIKPQ
tara:strand:+ start:19380 stop:19799 length:420 start_codon:yes stop_codon:yes gene_type:complete